MAHRRWRPTAREAGEARDTIRFRPLHTLGSLGNTRSASSGIAAELDAAKRDCERLRAENQRLKALLHEHGLALPARDSPPAVTTPTASCLASAIERSVEAKIALFRHLFRGRTDVYPVRWENRAGKSGYSPRAATNGVRAYAKGRVSSAAIVITVCCCR
jgi:hypothetical protein